MEIKILVEQLEDFYGTYVDYRGRLGGLTLLWKKHLTVNHIDVAIDGGQMRLNGGLLVFMVSLRLTINSKLVSCG